MSTLLFGIFIILHGLVHAWYVVLGFDWVKFQPDMGWTGHSWLLSSSFETSITKPIAGILFMITTLLFIISGIGIIANADWASAALLISAFVSSIVLIVFWDGHLDLIV